MPVDKDLLLELSRRLADLKLEKKDFNKDQNDAIKDIEEQIKVAIRED